jgi:hypothetical protein
MNTSLKSSSENQWICERCNKKLERGKAQIGYLGSLFTVDILKCPMCGIVMVTEEMAVNKMAEAEQLLEDK